MIGWISSRWLAAGLVTRALFAACLFLLVSLGTLAWYAKHVTESRAGVRAELAAWRSAAEAWGRQWEEERARSAALEALRVDRERERNADARRYAAARDDIRRLERELETVRDYLARPVPGELDQRLRDAEATTAGGVPTPAR